MNGILRRRRALMGAGETEKGLPATYQEVEYIQSSGSYCLIPTQFYFQLNDAVSFKASSATANAKNRCFFSTGANTDNCCYICWYGNSAYCNWCSQGGNNRVGSTSWASSSPYIFNFENGTITCTKESDPTVVYSRAYPTYTGVPETPLALMGNPATTGIGMQGRMYTFSVKRNGKKVFNAVPCYRKSDNVIGMFDTVSQTFLTNTGTGTLTKGADVA